MCNNQYGKSSVESIIIIVLITMMLLLVLPLAYSKIEETIYSVDRTNGKYIYKATTLVLAENDLPGINNKQYNLNELTVSSEGNRELNEIEQCFINLLMEKYDNSIPKILTYKDCDYIVEVTKSYMIIVKDSENRAIFPNPEEAYQ